MRVWRARRPFRCVGGMCSALCLRTSACDRAHGSKNFTRNLAIPNNLRITVSALCIASLLLRRLRLPHGTFFDYFWSSWKRKKVDAHAGLGKRRVHVLLSSIQSPSRTIVGSRTLPRACCPLLLGSDPLECLQLSGASCTSAKFRCSGVQTKRLLNTAVFCRHTQN